MRLATMHDVSPEFSPQRWDWQQCMMSHLNSPLKDEIFWQQCMMSHLNSPLKDEIFWQQCMMSHLNSPLKDEIGNNARRLLVVDIFHTQISSKNSKSLSIPGILHSQKRSLKSCIKIPYSVHCVSKIKRVVKASVADPWHFDVDPGSRIPDPFKIGLS